MNKYLILILCFTVISVEAKTPLSMVCDQKNVLELFENSKGLTFVETKDGRQVLSIPRKIKSIKLKPVTLEPGKKYKLSIRARVDSKDTIENNERVIDFAKRSYGRGFACYRLLILDDYGKKTGYKLYGKILIQHSGSIISRNMADYTYVFTTPPDIDKFQLEFCPWNNELFIESINLDFERDEKTLNCNPDFRYGILNPSGWRLGGESRFFQRPDGKTVLMSGYMSSTPFFPIEPSSFYSFFCKAIPYAKSSVSCSFYDKNFKKIKHAHLFRGKSLRNGICKNGVKSPPNAHYANVTVHRAIVEILNVTKDIAVDKKE